MSIDAGAYRRSAQRQLAQIIFDFPQPVNSMCHLAGVPAEFLAQPDGRGILQMSASDLQHLAKFLGLF